MRRREFITLLGGAAAAPSVLWPLAAHAQQDDRVRPLLMRILRMQAEAAAGKIAEFIVGIESQVGWTTQLPWSAGNIDQRRFDGLRLLRQAPAIAEITQLDSSGKEQLCVSRTILWPGTCDGGYRTDYSQDSKFTVAVAEKVYYGPVYFRRESEPYMTLSLAGTRRDAGVSVVEVNLKLIWDVVTGTKVGERGVAYVLDAQGCVIAHPDISLALRNADFSSLAQVQAAFAQVRAGRAQMQTLSAGLPAAAAPQSLQGVRDINGREVLAAYAAVVGLGWLVFVELPAEEANAPAQ